MSALFVLLLVGTIVATIGALAECTWRQQVTEKLQETPADAIGMNSHFSVVLRIKGDRSAEQLFLSRLPAFARQCGVELMTQ